MLGYRNSIIRLKQYTGQDEHKVHFPERQWWSRVVGQICRQPFFLDSGVIYTLNHVVCLILIWSIGIIRQLQF